MTYTQYPIEKFGGLLLRSQVETDPGLHAIDGLNFDLDDGGVVRPRNGINVSYGWHTGGSGYTPRCILAVKRPSAGSTHHFFGNKNGEIGAFSSVPGAPVFLTRPSGITQFLPFSTPTQESVMVMTDSDKVARITLPATLSTPAVTTINPITLAATAAAANTMPYATQAAVWAQESRVVYGGFTGPSRGPNGLVSSPDHVWISEPGDETRFRTDSFLVLSPGDGEKITCIRAWRDLVFIFKETKFFVLVNTQVSSRGVPKYNFRTIDTGIGCVGRQAADAGPDGLYFVSTRGIHMTRGDAPTCISNDVEPVFTGNVNTSFSGRVPQPGQDISESVLVIHNARLYVGMRDLGTGTPPPGAAEPAGGVLVYDFTYGWWSIWTPGGGVGWQALGVGYRFGSAKPVMLLGGWNSSFVSPGWQQDELLGLRVTTDGGSNSTVFASYSTGFRDVAQDSRVRVRQTEVWGWGTLNVSAVADYSGEFSVTEEDMTISTGTPPPVEGALMRKAFRATRVSLVFSDSSDGPHAWKVSRAVLHISNKLVASKVD